MGEPGIGIGDELLPPTGGIAGDEIELDGCSGSLLPARMKDTARDTSLVGVPGGHDVVKLAHRIRAEEDKPGVGSASQPGSKAAQSRDQSTRQSCYRHSLSTCSTLWCRVWALVSITIFRVTTCVKSKKQKPRHRQT